MRSHAEYLASCGTDGSCSTPAFAGASIGGNKYRLEVVSQFEFPTA